MLTADQLISSFDRDNKLLYQFVFFKTGGVREVAEDLTQQVFLKAWAAKERFDSRKASLKTWLFVIARNLVKDYYREHATHETVALDEIAELSDEKDMEDEVEFGRQLDRVKENIAKLSDEQQKLIVYRYQQGLSTKEIAKAIGKTDQATRVALHRAIELSRRMCHENI